MDRFTHRPTPASESVFENKEIILVLDNASYHQLFEPGFKVPKRAEGYCPQARSENGASREGVAQATRQYFEREDPKKFVEWVEAFMQAKGWMLI